MLCILAPGGCAFALWPRDASHLGVVGVTLDGGSFVTILHISVTWLWAMCRQCLPTHVPTHPASLPSIAAIKRAAFGGQVGCSCGCGRV